MSDQIKLPDGGFPAVERGSIKVFPDGLPAEWFKFLDESPWFIKGMSPEHAMQIASMLATDAFLTIQIWANEAWRQRELRRELAAALREEREKRRFWNHRNYQLVDKVRDQDWHLAYERAMREVVEACWMYASRAEEAYDAGFDHGSAYKERELFEAEQALAAVEKERDRLRGAILTHVASAIGDPLETGQAYAAFLARYDAAHPAPEEEADRG